MRKGTREFVRCAPASAVRWHDAAHTQPGNGLDGRRNDRLEQTAREMKAADEGGDLLDAGQALCVLKDVDGTGVRATRNNYQPFVADMNDDVLVIPNPWIRFPAAIGGARFLPGKALLKLRDSLDLAGDQDRTIDQQAGATRVSDVHTLAPQVIAAGGGMWISRPVGKTILRSRQASGWMRSGRRSLPYR